MTGACEARPVWFLWSPHGFPRELSLLQEAVWLLSPPRCVGVCIAMAFHVGLGDGGVYV